METTGYMKVYFDTVMNEMSDAMNLEGMDKDHRREIGESILNTAFDKEGPRSARRANDKLTFISEKLFALKNKSTVMLCSAGNMKFGIKMIS